ncbi:MULTISPECIES: hypothetical protein [unclassified Nostoc]|uniref:hypothetical protein n=1 Tax=unclassified Nostoc TaxID=2593658 RepID=UPI001D6D91BF|nr:hypothetical protein [Nostoc sp. JL34]MBN3886943.1 hypothetical protein [Nostoc sp. JL34]
MYAQVLPQPHIHILMKNSTPLAGWSFWAWGIGNFFPMPNDPKRRGDYPSTDTWGWSFPSLSMNLTLTKICVEDLLLPIGEKFERKFKAGRGLSNSRSNREFWFSGYLL